MSRGSPPALDARASASAGADTVRPIRELGESDIRPEVAYSLSAATVAWADYDRLQRDFPQLRADRLGAVQPGNSSGAHVVAAINDWLLRHTAVISAAQVQKNSVNREIPVSGRPRLAYRAPRGGRVLLVTLRDAIPEYGKFDAELWRDQPDGLLEVKGSGVGHGKIPQLTWHGTGLMLLQEAFRDLVNQRLIESVLKRGKVQITGVPVYAILDLGFDSRKHFTGWVPTAAMIRAARPRPVGGIDTPRLGSELQRIKLEVEFILRHFAITSSNGSTRFRIYQDGRQIKCRYGDGELQHLSPDFLHDFVEQLERPLPLRFDGINIQHTRDYCLHPLRVELIDFAHYEVRRSFNYPLFSFVFDQTLNWGGVLWPEDSRWVQPDPEEALNYDVAGRHWIPQDLMEWSGLGPANATETGAGILGLKLAREAHRRALDARQIDEQISQFVAAAMRQGCQGRVGA